MLLFAAVAALAALTYRAVAGGSRQEQGSPAALESPARAAPAAVVPAAGAELPAGPESPAPAAAPAPPAAVLLAASAELPAAPPPAVAEGSQAPAVTSPPPAVALAPQKLPEGAELPAELRAGGQLLSTFLKATGVGFPAAMAAELIGGVLGGIAEDNWWLNHGQQLAEQGIAQMLAAAQQQGGSTLRAQVAAEVDRRQVELYRKIWAARDPLWEALNGGQDQYRRLQAAKLGLVGRLRTDGLWEYVTYAGGESLTYDGQPGSPAYDGKGLTEDEREALAKFNAGVKAAEEAQRAILAEDDNQNLAQHVLRAMDAGKPLAPVIPAAKPAIDTTPAEAPPVFAPPSQTDAPPAIAAPIAVAPVAPPPPPPVALPPVIAVLVKPPAPPPPPTVSFSNSLPKAPIPAVFAPLKPTSRFE